MSALDLRRFELLRGLSQQEREIVARFVQAVDAAPGRVLFDAGDEAHGLVMVDAGRVRVERGEVLIGFAGPGDAFGGLALARVGTREVRAVAETPARLLVLGRSAFVRLADEAPRTACRVLEAILADLAGLVRAGLGPLLDPVVDRSQLHP